MMDPCYGGAFGYVLHEDLIDCLSLGPCSRHRSGIDLPFRRRGRGSVARPADRTRRSRAAHIDTGFGFLVFWKSHLCRNPPGMASRSSRRPALTVLTGIDRFQPRGRRCSKLDKPDRFAEAQAASAKLGLLPVQQSSGGRVLAQLRRPGMVTSWATDERRGGGDSDGASRPRTA